jgi:DnaJ domain
LVDLIDQIGSILLPKLQSPLWHFEKWGPMTGWNWELNMGYDANGILILLILQVGTLLCLVALSAATRTRDGLAMKASSPEPDALDQVSGFRGNWRYAESVRSMGHAIQTPSPRPINPLRQQYLRVLDLSDSADLIQIRQAYRRLALVYHPDRHEEEGISLEQRNSAAAKMQNLNRAYDWLCSNG